MLLSAIHIGFKRFKVSRELLFASLLILMPSAVFPQATNGTKIELLNADVSEFDEKLNADATRLIGNVRFRHESAYMNCDSAYLFRKENRLEAFGRIRITQGDSLNLTGGKLDYDGNTRIAQVYQNIVLTDRKMTLTTKSVFYDLKNASASFTDSAHIVDGENVLTSKTGFYQSETRDLYFKHDVLLINPRYTLECDTLRYNTQAKTAFFLGPTDLRTKDSKMYCESGWYNTAKQTSFFTKNAFLDNGHQILRGDSIYFNQLKNIGKAFGNVAIEDSSRSLIIRGNYAEHHQSTDSSWVTGRAEMVQYDNNDTLFMHADTLLAIGKRDGKDSVASRDIFAYHHVKLFKTDLQGMCDSLVYTDADSTIRFFKKPVLWTGYNQLTADSISLITSNSSLNRIILKYNSMIVSQADTLQIGIVDSLRFNQIAGKQLIGYFENNELDRISVTGNVQTIYYAKNSKNKDVAVNRVDCSQLMIRVKKNEIQKITFINDPDGSLYPIRELSISELRLKGFKWEQQKRPINRNDIFE